MNIPSSEMKYSTSDSIFEFISLKYTKIDVHMQKQNQNTGPKGAKNENRPLINGMRSSSLYINLSRTFGELKNYKKLKSCNCLKNRLLN